MLVLDDYTIALSSGWADISLPLQRLISIVSNNRAIALLFKVFKGFNYINNLNAENNAKLRQRLATYKVINVSLKNVPLKDRDLSEQIKVIEDQILMCGELKNDVDGLLEHGATRIFTNFKVSQKLLEELLSILYIILRTFKKNTKKSVIETSQLAIDITNHSEKTLLDIINGD